MRLNCDISTSQGYGTKPRTLYICFNVVPTQEGYGQPPNGSKLYNSDHLLFLDPNNLASNSPNNDLYIVGPYSKNVLLIGGQYYTMLDVHSIAVPPGTFQWGSDQYRGISKIHRVVDAAWQLKNLGWAIGFGLTNEPNNLGAYPSDAAGNPTSAAWGWPMTASSYAALWVLVALEIQNYAMNRYGWSVGVAWGEVSHYNGAKSDPTEEYNTPYDKVPPNVSTYLGVGYPDVRYPNLALNYYYYITGGLPAVLSFTYHDYRADWQSFIAYQQNAVTGAISPGYPGYPGNPTYQFNNPSYYMGQAPYVGKRFALGEWGSGLPIASDAAQFYRDVWNNTLFQNLGNILTSVYWYCDYDGSNPTTTANSAFTLGGSLAAVGTAMAGT